ncbi:MAG TPA: hypothetical protein VF743_03305 [Acidimicrobiales bacterium]
MRRDHGLAAVVVAATLLTAGCGADDGSDETRTRPDADAAAISAQALRSIADTTRDAQSFSLEMEMTISGMGGLAGGSGVDLPEEMTMSVSGAFDVAAERARLDMDMGQMFAGMTGGLGGADLPDDLVVHTIIDGDVMYVDYGALGGFMGLDGRWLRIDMSDAGAGPGGFWSQPGSMSLTDPESFVELLRGVSDDVETVGQEEVRGVPTTHVRATVDLRRAIEQAPEDQRDEMRAQYEDMGIDEMPMDVWVDGDGLPRRIEIDMAAGDASAMEGAGMAVRMEMFDYGEPVEVQVPGPDDVVDAGDLGFDPGAFGGGDDSSTSELLEDEPAAA